MFVLDISVFQSGAELDVAGGGYLDQIDGSSKLQLGLRPLGIANSDIGYHRTFSSVPIEITFQRLASWDGKNPMLCQKAVRVVQIAPIGTLATNQSHVKVEGAGVYSDVGMHLIVQALVIKKYRLTDVYIRTLISAQDPAERGVHGAGVFQLSKMDPWPILKFDHPQERIGNQTVYNCICVSLKQAA
jgi:hypothetical protein